MFVRGDEVFVVKDGVGVGGNIGKVWDEGEGFGCVWWLRCVIELGMIWW